jgi:Methyltransferase domain
VKDRRVGNDSGNLARGAVQQIHRFALSMRAFARKAINASLLAATRAVPDRLMAHYMFLLKSNPALTDRLEYHVRPIHYYDPIPDFRNVSAVQLQRRRRFPTIDFQFARQVELLAVLGSKCNAEIAAIAMEPGVDGFDFCNPYFPDIDACAYFALIRHLKPRKVIEIGSGYSTRIASLALRRNHKEGAAGELVCVEPFPEKRLMDSDAQFTLVQKRVEDLDPASFASLGENDILFIDSSHVARVGSDVCAEFLDILPNLRPGVWVHVHDIFFPEDYPANWVIERRIAFNEQYILEAFLSFNAAFSVRLANHWMWLEHRDAVKALCPEPILVLAANGTGPASFWMRKDA